jgi:integrase
MTKRHHGDGGIDQRGENSWRLRYRINGKRYSQAFHGTLPEARKKLRELIRSGDTGTHIEPDRITVGEWISQWLAAGAPGKKQRRPSRRSVERYEQLLRGHVVPTIGTRRLQHLQATEIDKLYADLADKLSTQTVHMVHNALGSCLRTATRTGLLISNPIDRVLAPPADEGDHGLVLDVEQIRKLVDGFRESSLFAIVAVAAFTGARRNEILALRWSDLDVDNKTLRIERALEGETGRVKPPKTRRGIRTISIDDDLVALLIAEREKYLRLVAGVPDDAAVDLSLIKLPEEALIFPTWVYGKINLTKPRRPNAVTLGFARRASKLGFKGLCFHDLRGSYETALLEAGEPVHVVAERCGHDPAVLLKTYAKRTTKADRGAAATTGKLFKGIL